MCGMAGLCVQSLCTQEGSAEERINTFTWKPVPVPYPYLFTPGFTGLHKTSPVADCQTSGVCPVCCFRQTTQDAPEEVRNRDFRRELEERERVAAREKNRDRPTRGKNQETKILTSL